MAALPWAGRRAAWTLAGLTMVGISCTEPRSTEPDFGEPASARSGGTSPTVTSVDPPEAPQSTTLDVRVLGSNYDQGSRVDFARAGVIDPKLHVNSTSYLSATELVANVSIAVDAAPVSYDVVVSSSRGKKGIGTEKFAVVVPVELLSAPAGGSAVSAVSDNGLMVGRIATTCSFIAAAPALWNQLGQLIALPLPSGTCGGVPRGINSAGVAVGNVYTESGSAGSFRWVPLGGSYQAEALPPLADGSSAGAWAINEGGTVVGGNVAAVLKAGATAWQLLQRPSGATNCSGRRITNLDAVAGRCTIAGRVRGVYWASPTAAPVLLPLPSGATDVYLWDMNDAGVIVGFAVVSIGKNKFVNRATRWTLSGGGWTTEFLADKGLGSAAFAINDVGQVAGSLGAFPHGPRPAFWGASGSLRQLEGTGEALGLSGSTVGPVVGGNANGGAARWQP